MRLLSNLTGESPVHEPEWPHHHAHKRIQPRADKEPRIVRPSHSFQYQLSCPGEEFGRVSVSVLGRGGGRRDGSMAEEKDEWEGEVDQTEWGAQEEGGHTAKQVANSPCTKRKTKYVDRVYIIILNSLVSKIMYLPIAKKHANYVIWGNYDLVKILNRKLMLGFKKCWEGN